MRLLCLLLVLPAIAAAAPVDDLTQRIAEAIGRACSGRAAQTVAVRDFDTVQLAGNGGIDEAANAVLIRAGSPVSIKFGGPKDERTLTAIRCDLKITPITAERGGKLVLRRVEGVPDPFMTKVLAGDLAGVRELVQAGQDINITSPVSPLMAAAGRGHAALTKYLLEQGARVNDRAPNGKTALHAAAEFGPVDVAGLLLEHGAKIDAVDRNGYTPLWGAAFNNRPEMIEFLLQKGASLRHRDKNGNTALSPAALNGANDAIRKLVERGLAPDTKNKFGRTPLFDAIEASREDTVVLFVEYKAGLNARKESGQTPLGLAQARGDARIIAILRKAGAR